MKRFSQMLWMALLPGLLLTMLAGCSTARWTLRKERTPQAATHTSKGSEERAVNVTAAGEYEIIRLPDGSYFIRPVPAGKGAGQ